MIMYVAWGGGGYQMLFWIVTVKANLNNVQLSTKMTQVKNTQHNFPFFMFLRVKGRRYAWLM